eukprot:CAMPEP_0185614112 /NCGR_PEP_ID=MMETSP0436-20130131/30192_1 /TAXON_ID=626734 ORGANISM="Favella taraikaensis, Strain Fe Narragansett Bay" /NCGR_SAMPLE_ID=MMETSP0436 /ASSEMBLY_ACC=CAM_ASM_000390 /LENGTH=55 /DNA_ID=CAMNT_0028248623 /DNA_START=49 /DNA_END=216 /DNA_ORIENTATION=-
MELMTWLWAFDKRLLCCVRYGSRTFAYIWLMPAIAAALTLALTWTYQFTSEQHEF